MSKKSMSDNGFTIIEITVVLLISGLLVCTAGSGIRKGTAFFNLQYSAQKMAADIRELQQMALSEESSQYLIKFDKDYYVMRKTAHPLPVIVANVDLPPTARIEYNNFPDQTLRLSAKGLPLQGGTITLRDQVTGKRRYVIIASITGRVRVSDQPVQ